MQAEPRRFADQWKDLALPGKVIQIRGESILFKPRASTRPLWLFLDGQDPPVVGEASIVVNPAVFDCKRIIPHRGKAVKVPCVDYHKDELESARGRLVALDEAARCFVLNIGFPVVVSLLADCQELRRARPGEILALDFAPPAQGHPI